MVDPMCNVQSCQETLLTLHLLKNGPCYERVTYIQGGRQTQSMYPPRRPIPKRFPDKIYPPVIRSFPSNLTMCTVFALMKLSAGMVPTGI